MNDQAKLQLDELKKKLTQVESLLVSAKTTIEKFEREYMKTDYTQIEGISGWYDGKAMQGDDGKVYEVPENYAAKSKIVYGDKLKLIEENGKKLYKQTEQVERLKVDGILTKKEGEWYLLCDRGSYKVSDVAAEFQGAAINSEVTAFLPKDNLNTPFATIDNVIGFGKNTKSEKPQEAKSPVNVKKPSPVAKKPSMSVKKAPSKKVEKIDEPKKAETQVPSVKASAVAVDEDDLV